MTEEESAHPINSPDLNLDEDKNEPQDHVEDNENVRNIVKNIK